MLQDLTSRPDGQRTLQTLGPPGKSESGSTSAPWRMVQWPRRLTPHQRPRCSSLSVHPDCAAMRHRTCHVVELVVMHRTAYSTPPSKRDMDLRVVDRARAVMLAQALVR